MFSQRLGKEGISPNRISQLLGNLEAQGKSVLDLTISNPTRIGLGYPKDEILRAMADPACLRFSPEPLGLWKTREAVARYYQDRGSDVSASDVAITASTSEAYSFLFKLLAEAGQHILVPRPSYPLLSYLSALENLTVRGYPLMETEAWRPDTSLLQDLASHPGCAAVAVVHPNNPTGSLLRRPDFLAICDTAREADVAVIFDEVFFDYPLGEEAGLDVSEQTQALTFVLNGLSKTAALPQMKLSWIVVRGPESLKSQAIQRLETIADHYLSVASPVQHALPRLLELRHDLQSAIRERLQTNLQLLRGAFSGTAVTVPAVEAGWYANLHLPRIRSDEEWALHLLERYRTLTHPGYFFDFPREAVLVISLLTPEREFREGVITIRKLAGESQGATDF